MQLMPWPSLNRKIKLTQAFIKSGFMHFLRAMEVTHYCLAILTSPFAKLLKKRIMVTELGTQHYK